MLLELLFENIELFQHYSIQYTDLEKNNQNWKEKSYL